jgi:hypothetical protein
MEEVTARRPVRLIHQIDNRQRSISPHFIRLKVFRGALVHRYQLFVIWEEESAQLRCGLWDAAATH